MLKIRRSDRATDIETALQVVDKCAFATLAMIAPDGAPYCVPVSIVREGNCIYFHAAEAGFKTDCLTANPAVCVSCVGNVSPLSDQFSLCYESATLRGSAEPVTAPADKLHILSLIASRYTPAHMDAFEQAASNALNRTAIWRIRIESITGKRRS